MSPRTSVAGAVLALAIVGCGGATSEPAPAPESSKTEVREIKAAAVPLRRLTREEYDNTVRDLLGDRTRPAASFPPDEAVGGFETNSLAPVSSSMVERYMEAAEALATGAASRVSELAPCAAGDEPEDCAKRFVEAFGRRAFRRPLQDEERASFLAVYTEKAKKSGHAAGIQLVIQALLQSPQFLYRLEPAVGSGSEIRPLDGYEVATRLSYFIWASTPDDALLDAAAAGKLATQAEVEEAARRMLGDPRAVDGLRSYFRQWLGLRELETETREASITPAFTPALRDAMVEETLRFSADAVLTGGDAVTTLLTSSKTFVNAPLAKLYGVSAPEGDTFQLVSLPPEQRAGVLTHASVMTVLSGAEQTSPILRGKFVREKLLCDPIPPPPPSAVISAPKVDPRMTTKERFVRHRTDPSCSSCHQLMDPIGFAFEHYDMIGAWRTMDGYVPVDAVGDVYGTDDVDGAYTGAIKLTSRLAASEQVRRCVATHWFRYALGRTERDEDQASLGAAYESFQKAGFDLRQLIVAIAGSDAFRHTGLEEKKQP
ncbi:MAG: DUF1592 domain-containing protein [Myxococcales bacterium]|nr:DUF1592 domain-containing protein [Myxococcales bacterium]